MSPAVMFCHNRTQTSSSPHGRLEEKRCWLCCLLKDFHSQVCSGWALCSSCHELKESVAEPAAPVTLWRWGQQTHKGVLGVEITERPCRLVFLNQTFVLLWPHSSLKEIFDKTG